MSDNNKKLRAAELDTLGYRVTDISRVLKLSEGTISRWRNGDEEYKEYVKQLNDDLADRTNSILSGAIYSAIIYLQEQVESGQDDRHRVEAARILLDKLPDAKTDSNPMVEMFEALAKVKK